MNKLILILGITFLSKTLANQQLISVLPAGTFGVGGQSLLSGIPFTTANGQQMYVQQQPSVLQLVRQPSGLTQVLGQPSVTQLVGGQGQPSYVTGVDGLTGLGQPLIITTNGAGLSSLPYPYTVGGLSSTNLNGVPVIVTSPVGYAGVPNTGIQTIPFQPQTQFVQQPFYGTNPVIRQVNEQEISPIDAALLDMENKGMMHSEQYAWGRSSAPPTNQPPSESDTAVIENASPNEQRSAEMPIYYPLPTEIAPPSPTIGVRTPPNPFVNGAGKRRKHFELYQYYRNMDMNTPRLLVPFQ